MPVHCLMDEYANISLPKDTFLSALATMRSRAIFCSIIVQNMAQLKAMYKDDWESLVGLCDEFLYSAAPRKKPQVCFGTAGQGNHLHDQLQPKQRAQRQLQHQPPGNPGVTL